MTDFPIKDSEGNTLEKGVLYEVMTLGRPLSHPHLFQGFNGSDYLFETQKGEKTYPIVAVDSLIRYSQEELGHLFSEYHLLVSWIEKIRAPYIKKILKEVRDGADRRITAPKSEEEVRQMMEDVDKDMRLTRKSIGMEDMTENTDEISKPWVAYHWGMPTMYIGKVVRESPKSLDIQYREGKYSSPELWDEDPDYIKTFDDCLKAIAYCLVNNPGETREEVIKQVLRDFPSQNQI